MVYGYARVSTAGQDLEIQREALINAGVNFIFSEKFTGTTKERPELKRMLGMIKRGDKVVVCKLDRIARSAKEGLEIIDELIEKGVSVEVLNMGKFDATPSGKLMRTIMLAFAEFERDMIVERCTEGKEVARMRPGFSEGRPALSDSIVEGIKSGKTHDELGISKSCWYKYRRRVGSA